MRIYRNTTKRIGKKKIGRRWKKLNLARNLRLGDLVSTCKGYNERVSEIDPIWSNRGLSRGRYIIDFDITTESGSSCSVVQCCTFPTETREEIIEYWRWFATPEGRAWEEEMSGQGWKFSDGIVDAIAEGREVFDQDGQPLYEFAKDYEQVARFFGR